MAKISTAGKGNGARWTLGRIKGEDRQAAHVKGQEAGFLNGSGKGQSVSLDLMFGLFIFLVMFTYVATVLFDLADRYVGNANLGNAELAAISAANRLVMAGGEPFNWSADATNAKSVGFAQMPGVLDMSKLKALERLPYAEAHNVVGIGNDFSIVVEENDGSRYATIGLQERNATYVVEVTRQAVLDGRHVNVRVRVYGEGWGSG